MKLKELRLSKKLKQSDIAKVLDISSQAYGNYETGRRQPTPETLKTLADYFGVTTDYLLGRETKKEPSELTEDSISKTFLDNGITKEKYNTLTENQKNLILAFAKELINKSDK